MSGAAAKRSRKKSALNSDKKPPRLWVDPKRLPNAKIHFTPPERAAEDFLMNRYLELADLVLKEPINDRKKSA